MTIMSFASFGYEGEIIKVEAELNNWNLESKEINNPDASVGVCCSHKVVAVGFNTLCYDASVGGLNHPHEYRGRSTRVEPLCGSNCLTTSLFYGIGFIHLMRLSFS